MSLTFQTFETKIETMLGPGPDGQPVLAELMIPDVLIQNRIDQMSAEIAEWYVGTNRLDVHVITVMNGAFHFASDLRRGIQRAEPDLRLTSQSLKLTSYSGNESSGVVRIEQPLDGDQIVGNHVVICEDIYDTGLTLAWLTNYLQSYEPASLEVATLLSKNNLRRSEANLGDTALHVGFEIPNKFVVGYGMDYGNHYRDLADIYSLPDFDIE